MQHMRALGRIRLPVLAASAVTVVGAVLAIAIVSAPEVATHGLAVHTVAGATDHSEHTGPVAEMPITEAATSRKLDAELAAARQSVAGIHTAADAMARGYVRVTVDLAFLGVHYMNPASVGKPFDSGRPTHLVFDTDAPDAPLVGLMYYIDRPGSPPSGFAGPNDAWHRHLKACMGNGLMLALDDIRADQCARIGGTMTNLGPEFRTRWMLHAWVVPGQKNPWGVFANGDPALAKVGRV